MIKWLQPYFFQFDQHHKTQVTDKKKNNMPTLIHICLASVYRFMLS